MNRLIASSGLIQRLVFLALICAGSMLVPNGARAGHINNPVGDTNTESSIESSHAKPGSVNTPADSAEASGRSADTGLAAATPALEPDHGDDEGHVSAAADSDKHAMWHTGHVDRAYRTGDLKDQIVAGINMAPGDLKQLLPPGTIIHFWASWCRPCAEEIPQLERFYRTRISKDLSEKGIRLVTISNDRAAGPAAHFIEKYGTTFPVYLDTEQIANLAIVGKRTLPATVMVGADGRFHRLSLGKFDWDFPRLPDLLEAVLTRNASGGIGEKD